MVSGPTTRAISVIPTVNLPQVTAEIPLSEGEANMIPIAKSLIAAQREASRRVGEARKFSIKLPLIGTVRVPPPEQLAIFSALGV